MIIEIALGIVLAVLVLVLMNLDWILGLGLILVVVAIGLVAIGVAIYFAATYPTEAAFAVGAVAPVSGAVYLESRTGNFKTPAPLDAPAAAAPNGVGAESHTSAKFTWDTVNKSGKVAIAVYLLAVAALLLYFLGRELAH